MKLSFSIDVILGNDKNEKENKSSNIETCQLGVKRKSPNEDAVDCISPFYKSRKLSPNACVRRPNRPPAQGSSHKFHPLRFLPYPVQKIESYQVRHHPDYYPFHLPYMSTIPSAEQGVFTAPDSNHQHMSKASVSEVELTGSHQIPKQVKDEAIKSSPRSFSPASVASPNEERSSSEDSQSSPQINKNSKDLKSRVGRRLFSGLQILELENAFAEKPYINRMERAVLALQVKLTESQIKTWFQNRRTKEKRRGDSSEPDDASSVKFISNKAIRIPGHGIQVRPTFGPPDQHLRAAIDDYFKKKRAGLLISE